MMRPTLAVLTVLLAGCAPPEAPEREIVVVTRGMSFTVDGASEPNPTLSMQAGERVRLVLRNESPGLLHNLEVPEWGLATRTLRSGEEDEVRFTAPDQPGHHAYICRPHKERMNGLIVVTPR